MRPPQVGDIVLYVAPDGSVRPAIVIVPQNAGRASLSIFTDGDRTTRAG